jgi:general secretion pathway protein A
LSLRQPNGGRVQAVLVGLDATRASFQVGAQRYEVPLVALASVWRGEFFTLWRTPEGWRPGGGADLSGSAKAWAQAQMSKAMPQTPARNWSEQVSAFQLVNGLPSDGQAGPMTLMQLNRSAGVEEPFLSRTPER